MLKPERRRAARTKTGEDLPAKNVSWKAAWSVKDLEKDEPGIFSGPLLLWNLNLQLFQVTWMIW